MRPEATTPTRPAQVTSGAGRVAGILLAAGSSTRMGRNKLLLDLDGESVLRRSARTAGEAGLDPVIVVLGPEPERTARELDGLDCIPVFNPEHELGTHASVRVGIERMPPDVSAAVLILADMPFVTSGMLETLVGRHRDGGRLVVSRYGDRAEAPPTLYDRRYFAELSRMTRKCAKEVVRRHRHEADVVEWPGAALADLDRPEDYERIVARLATG